MPELLCCFEPGEQGNIPKAAQGETRRGYQECQGVGIWHNLWKRPVAALCHSTHYFFLHFGCPKSTSQPCFVNNEEKWLFVDGAATTHPHKSHEQLCSGTLCLIKLNPDFWNTGARAVVELHPIELHFIFIAPHLFSLILIRPEITLAQQSLLSAEGGEPCTEWPYWGACHVKTLLPPGVLPTPTFLSPSWIFMVAKLDIAGISMEL